MAEELNIVVKARDDASRSLQGINGRLQQMSKQLRMVGMGMTIAGGAITGALGMSIKSFAKAGDEVQKMALRTGFATETLSELKHALEISGASLSAVDKAAKTMSKAIADGIEGLSTYVREFDRLGISAEDLAKLKPEEQFMTIALAIAELPTQYEKAAAAQVIFGRAGTQMLPMLAAGAEGIQELRDEAHQLGIVFDQEAADKAAEFNDALLRLKESISGLKFQIGEVLAPVVSSLADKITALVATVREWGEAHPALYSWLVKVVGVMGLLALAIGPVLMALPFLVSGFALVIPAVMGVVTAVWAGVYAWIAYWVAVGPAGWAILGTISGLLIGLGVSMKRHNDSVRESTNIARKWYGQTEQNISIIDKLKLKVNELHDSLDRIVEVTFERVISRLELMSELFKKAWEWIKRLLDLFMLEWRVPVVRGIPMAGRAAYVAAGMKPPGASFEKGGVMPYTGMALLHKGETVLPTRGGQPILQVTSHIYLDGEEVTKTVMDRIATHARLEGAY